MKRDIFNKNRSNKIEAAQETGILRIAVAGNPNAGKTSLFNALTGQTQHVGNYPGVTVEKKTGRIQYANRTIEFIDLPGTYSLTAYSIEEIVTRDFVLKDKPDLILDVLDSTNLERNLYLCLQFQELGVPIVGALNMTDEAEAQGIEIDAGQLSKVLGIPFVKTVGSKGLGKDELLKTVVQVAEGKVTSTARHLNYGRELEAQHNQIIEQLRTDSHFTAKYKSHWMAIKLLENDTDAIRKVQHEYQDAQKLLEMAAASRKWIKKHFGEDSEVVVGEQRYAYIYGACREAVTVSPDKSRIDYTELIDKLLLHRYFGLVFFFVVMFLIYQLTFMFGNPLSDQLDIFFTFIQNTIIGYLPAGILRDFLVEGIIGGVGGVLVFFPIVVLLFLGLSFLEDTGYMARAAFVMDKFMHIFGLHGRSFIPMMVSTGCAVPGVMSARTLVNPKDRILTILISPLMMCGAKVPVIAMLASAFFPKNAATVFWSIWFFSWLLALLLARIFRNILFKGETSPFVMELPPYRLPTVRGVLTHVWDKSWSYVKKAGTFILAASIIMWVMLSFPRVKEYKNDYAKQINTASTEYNMAMSRLDSINAVQVLPNQLIYVKTRQLLQFNYQQVRQQINLQRSQEDLNHSFGGKIGKLVEPIFASCGFDWRLDMTLIAGFAAKEVIVSAMGIIYGIGEADIEEVSGTSEKNPLKQKLSKDPAYNQLNILAFMLFVLVYLPCIATMAVVKKELGKWKYPLFLAGYTLCVAWLLATVVFQIGHLFGLG